MYQARWLALCLLAQLLPAGPIETGRGTVTIAGDVTATIGSRDDIAFFNYTDYEHNALRMLRVSLSGMWRPAARVAFLTELRSEDAERVIPYAWYVRVRPWKKLPLDLQAGRIPPVFGAFGRRSYGAENNLIGYPLAYQYLTSLRPDAIPASADDLLVMRGRGWLASYPVGVRDAAPGVPLISAYRWDTGVQGHVAAHGFEAAAAVTSGTLSNPRIGDDNTGRQISVRGAWKPIAGLILGVSGARGEFLTQALEDLYAPVLGARRYSQRAIGLDAEYSRGYWIIRTEAVLSRWNLPKLNRPFLDVPLRADAAFLETRYQFTPRLFAAARIDGLTFSTIRGERLFAGQATPWDAPVSRLEAGGGIYLQRNLIARAVVQRNARPAGRVHTRTFLSAQLAYWF
jgi:hypothetical protein